LTFFIAPTLTPAFCGPYSRANFSAKFIERSVRHGLASGLSCVKGNTCVRLVSFHLDDGKSGDVPTAHWYDSGYCQGFYGCHYSSPAIAAKNFEPGLPRTAVGTEEGSYRFSALPVGAYEVRAEQPGFRTEVRSGLTLTVSQEAVVNFTLQPGALDQTVVVTEEAPLVNTTSGALGGLVDERKVSELPLNGAHFV